MKSDGQKDALDTLSREVENIRAAWRWAIARDKVVEIQEIAWSLFLFYDIRNRFQEGAEMFREAATALDKRDVNLEAVQHGTDSRPAETRRALLGLLLVVQGWFLHFFEPDQSRAVLQRGMEHLEPLGPRKELALANILSLYADTWSPSRPEQRARESLAFFEESDDLWGVALASDALSYTLCGEDDTAAEHYAQQSLELRRQLGDRWGTALALFTLGWVAEYQGMWQVAKRRYHESMELRRGMREDVEGVMDCLNGMGRVARRMGDYDEARRLHLEILALAREMGNRWRIARSLESLGLIAYDLEKYAETKRYVEQSLALYEDGGAKFRIAFSAGTLGHVALALGDYEEARRCFERALGVDARNSWTLLGLGRLSDALGDEVAALGYFHRALRRAVGYRIDAMALDVLIDVARLRLKSDAPEHAVKLLGFVLNHHAISHSTKVRAEQLLAEVEDALPAETIETALARGKACELEAVVGGILGTGELPTEEQDVEVKDAPDYVRRLLGGRFA